LIAARTGRSEPEVEALFARCEDIIRGDRSSKNEVVQLVTNLRRLELDLGLLPRRQKSAE
jgi:hypothetical protein